MRRPWRLPGGIAPALAVLVLAHVLPVGGAPAGAGAGGVFRFALVTDIHISPGSGNIRRLDQVVEDINRRPDIAFTVVTGDLGNRGERAELDQVAAQLRGLRRPCHVVPGNHDTNWSDNAARRFAALFGAERFSFEHAGVGCIGISTGPYLKMGDGFVRSEDLEFLRRELAEHSRRGRPVILFCHYPVSGGLSGADSLAELLNRPGVRTLGVACGHYHRTFRQRINRLEHFVGGALAGHQGHTLYHVFTCSPEGGLAAVERDLTLRRDREFPRVDDVLYHEREIPDIPETPDFRIERIFSAGASVYTAVSVGPDGRLLLGTSRGEVIMLAAGGGLLWRRRMSGGAVYSNPLFLDGAVGAVGLVEREIRLFDLRDGSTLKRIGPTPAEATANGLVEDGRLYIGGGREELLCLDARGRRLWTARGFGTMQARPAANSRAVFFGAWDRQLHAVDKRSGKTLWNWSNGLPQTLLSPGNVIPAVTERQVVVVAPDRRMTALDAATGEQIWRSAAAKVRESLGISPDHRRIYAKTMDGFLVAVQADSPRFLQLWRTDLGIGYEHAPCNILETGGVVYAGSRRGCVAAVAARTGELLWRRKLGDSAVNFLTGGGRWGVYCSLIEGHVYRVRRRSR